MKYSIKKCNNFFTTVAQAFFEFINDHESGVIALSGGNTPPKIFNELYNLHEFESILQNLAKFTFIPTDERNVDASHEDNNSSMILKELFKKNEVANFLRLQTCKTIDNAISINNNTLESIDTPILSIIGVGDDGHTASLFPGRFNPKDCDKIVNGGMGPDGHERISLSHNYLLSSKNIWILCNSDSKLEALKKSENDTEMPLHQFLQMGSIVYTH